MSRVNMKGVVLTGLAAVPLCLAIYLLITYVQRERATGSRITCQNNLRQIGQAMRMYVADNDGFMPSAQLWTVNAFPSATRSGCPVAEPVPRLEPPLSSAEQGLPGYAFNGSLWGGNKYVAHRLTAMPLPYTNLTHPQTTIAVLDYTPAIPVTQVLDRYGKMYGGWPKQLPKGWKRHNGGGNYLFCDGHVGWFLESRILVTEPDICDGDKTRPNFCVD